MSLFDSLRGDPEDEFVDRDRFAPEFLPAPGPALADATVLTDDDHHAVHEAARAAFEDRGVYDATFGYNLAKLNRDRRHPDAGLRYGRPPDDPSALVVEFTPTTPVCPQGETLGVGAARALRAELEASVASRVSVRVTDHQRTDAINDRLAGMDGAVGTDPSDTEQ